MPGLVQFDSRSDAGFGCFTAVCTDANSAALPRVVATRVDRRRSALLVCYMTLDNANFIATAFRQFLRLFGNFPSLRRTRNRRGALVN